MPLIDLAPQSAHEALIGTAQEAADAASKILDAIKTGPPRATLETREAEEIAELLAGALCTVLSLSDQVREDDNQLVGALTRWLP